MAQRELTAPSKSETHTRATRREQRVGQTLMAIIAVVAVAAALRATAAVMVPLAFALFLVAVFWPLQRRFQQRMPRGLAIALTLLLFFVVVGLFVGALAYSADTVADQWPRYAERFQAYGDQLRAQAQNYGIRIPGGQGANGGTDLSTIQPFVLRGIEQVLAIGTAFVLVTGFLLFGLLEVYDFRTKLRAVTDSDRINQWMSAIHKITHDFQRYIVVRTFIGLITGTAVWIFCLIVGLDLAFVWGLSNFLLNYIPTLGSVIAVIPPPLFALVQFNNPAMALLVFAGVAGIQVIMGQYVDPWLQGKYLALSPLVVLFSVTFWGWLWGVAGAFISVPLTILVVIACNQFDRTRWIATLLAETPAETEDDGRARDE